APAPLLSAGGPATRPGPDAVRPSGGLLRPQTYLTLQIGHQATGREHGQHPLGETLGPDRLTGGVVRHGAGAQVHLDVVASLHDAGDARAAEHRQPDIERLAYEAGVRGLHHHRGDAARLDGQRYRRVARYAEPATAHHDVALGDLAVKAGVEVGETHLREPGRILVRGEVTQFGELHDPVVTTDPVAERPCPAPEHASVRLEAVAGVGAGWHGYHNSLGSVILPVTAEAATTYGLAR